MKQLKLILAQGNTSHEELDILVKSYHNLERSSLFEMVLIFLAGISRPMYISNTKQQGGKKILSLFKNIF